MGPPRLQSSAVYYGPDRLLPLGKENICNPPLSTRGLAVGATPYPEGSA